MMKAELLSCLGESITRKIYFNPIFIIGQGRSGTTALLESLFQHPNILGKPIESPLIHRIGHLVFDFEYHERKEYYKTSLQMPLNTLYMRLRNLCFESVFGKNYGLKFIASCIKHNGFEFFNKRHWIAKAFPDFDDYRGLSMLYPNAKFIYISRVGYDQIFSSIKFPKHSGKSFIFYCQSWRNFVEKYAYALNCKNTMHIKYEDFKENPSETFQAIYKFLGVDFSAKPIEYQNKNLIHSLDVSTVNNTDVKKILSEREPAYKKWNEEEKEIFKKICGEAMQKLSYKIPF